LIGLDGQSRWRKRDARRAKQHGASGDGDGRRRWRACASRKQEGEAPESERSPSASHVPIRASRRGA
jgi:hypothetical protein